MQHNFKHALLINQSPTTNNTHQNLKLQLQQPTNLAIHNLCHDVQPPSGMINLLGQVLKYCIVPPKASPNVKECYQKLAYRMRTRQYRLTSNRPQDQTHNPPNKCETQRLEPYPCLPKF